MENLPYFILLALLAEILGTVGGFGSSLFFVPLASFFLDFYSVLGITAVFHLSSNITKIAMFRKGVDKSLILKIGIPAVLFVIVGAYFSQYLNKTILEIILGCFLVGMAASLMFVKSFKVKPTLLNSIIGGALSGALAGIVGTGGAIRGLTLAAFGLSMEVFVATSAIIDLGIDLSRSVVYFSNGFIHKHDLYLIPILAVVSIVGTYIGKRILLRISEEKFKKIVLIIILAIGISTLVKVIISNQ